MENTAGTSHEMAVPPRNEREIVQKLAALVGMNQDMPSAQ